MDVELMKNKLLLLFLLDRNEIIVMKKIVISNQFKNDLTIWIKKKKRKGSQLNQMQ